MADLDIAQAPPRVDAPLDEPPRVLDAELAAEIAAREKRTLKQAWTDNVLSTVGQTIARNVQQRVDPNAGAFAQAGQTILAVTGQAGKWGAESWDKKENFDALTKGVPREYWEDIFDQSTVAGAQITRANVLSELQRNQRMGLDTGAAAAIGLAGGLLDVDAPLALLSGGGLTGAKAAGKLARIGAGKRVSGAVGGAIAGAEAGLLVGAGAALNSDTTTWMDGVVVGLGTTIIGAAGGAMSPETVAGLRTLRDDFTSKVAEGSDDVWDDLPQMDDFAPASNSTDWQSAPFVEHADEGEDFDVPAYYGPEQQSLSAGAVRQGPLVFQALKDPLGRMSDTSKKIISASRNYVFGKDIDFQRNVLMDDWLGKLSTHPVFNPGTNNLQSMLKSRSTVLNRMIGAVFDMPGGQVRGDVATAANLSNMYERRLSGHLTGVSQLRNEFAAQSGRYRLNLPNGTGVGASIEAEQEFNRRVMLDMNAAAMGRGRDTDANIRAASDAYSNAGMESLDVMRGRAGEIPLEGAQTLQPKTMFMPYRANGAKMAQGLIDGKYTQQDLVDAYTTSYLNAGVTTDRTVADAMATAYVSRFLGKAVRVDDSMLSLFSRDGREFLNEALKSAGIPPNTLDRIMSRFDGDMEERGKLGSLKHRNDLDFSVPIGNSGLQIVDMMRGDLDNVYTGYIREVAGASSLARHGITSKSNRKEWIEAAAVEQRALGETPMDSELIEAMFSTFDGGPQWGYSKIGGTTKGIGVASEIKSLASLSVLTFNGFAQLAETGVTMMATGLDQWYRGGIGKLVDKAIVAADEEALDAFKPFLGEIGNDQNTLKAHLSMDESQEFFTGSSQSRAFMSRAREFLDKGNYIQGYTSGMNFVRSHQQKVLVTGMAHKVLLQIKNSADMSMFEVGGRLFRDMAIDVDMAKRIKAQIDAGVVEFKTTPTRFGKDIEYVNRWNLHMWPEDLAQDMSAALNRSLGQNIQQALSGETDRWMHTTLGAMVTHLQTFPILAIQKQFFRHALSRDREATLTALAGIATAYMALSIRDAVTGNDRGAAERGKAAFGYANITGWMPMYADPIFGALGLNDLRFNQFGPYAEPISIPAVDVFNHLLNAPGSLINAAQGEQLNGIDRQHLRAIPFFRLAEAAKNMATFGPEIPEPPKPKKQD